VRLQRSVDDLSLIFLLHGDKIMIFFFLKKKKKSYFLHKEWTDLEHFDYICGDDTCLVFSCIKKNQAVICVCEQAKFH
jgi:hypothetical protein